MRAYFHQVISRTYWWSLISFGNQLNVKKWFQLNSEISDQEIKFFHFKYYTFPTPLTQTVDKKWRARGWLTSIKIMLKIIRLYNLSVFLDRLSEDGSLTSTSLYLRPCPNILGTGRKMNFSLTFSILCLTWKNNSYLNLPDSRHRK